MGSKKKDAEKDSNVTGGGGNGKSAVPREVFFREWVNAHKNGLTINDLADILHLTDAAVRSRQKTFSKNGIDLAVDFPLTGSLTKWSDLREYAEKIKAEKG